MQLPFIDLLLSQFYLHVHHHLIVFSALWARTLAPGWQTPHRHLSICVTAELAEWMTYLHMLFLVSSFVNQETETNCVLCMGSPGEHPLTPSFDIESTFVKACFSSCWSFRNTSSLYLLSYFKWSSHDIKLVFTIPVPLSLKCKIIRRILFNVSKTKIF